MPENHKPDGTMTKEALEAAEAALLENAEPLESDPDEVPEMPPLPFEIEYKTIVNPTGAPDTYVAILVSTKGDIKIGVSKYGEDDAVDDALLP